MNPQSSSSTSAALSSRTHPGVGQSLRTGHDKDGLDALKLVGFVTNDTAHAFEAGWRAGTARRATSPASEDAIDEVVTMLDAARLADALIRRER